MSLRIADDRVGVFHYIATRADTGELIETSINGEPMVYLHGHGNVVPGLEEALTGLQEGDKIDDLVVPAARAYGEKTGEEPVRIPRKELPKGRDWVVGARLVVPGDNDEPVALWVTKAQGAGVYFTREHPLAGVDIRFTVRMIQVRQAREVEIEHGHPRGIDGYSAH